MAGDSENTRTVFDDPEPYPHEGSSEQQDVSPATAGGAPAPDFNAIREAVLDSFRAVPLWQLRQGLVAAGLIPADVEIQAAERKPVTGGPGIEAEWDEDVDAMRVDGIGWDLSFGCKVSFAYDHAKGEHYVCVSTSDADQRAGITSRRTTKEQLASLGQQLLNVFGEPDAHDAEIEQLRGEVYSNNVALGRVVHRVSGALGVKPGSKDAAELASMIRDVMRERNEAREEWKRADAEVTRLRGRVDELASIRVALFGEVRSALTERDTARAERDFADAQRKQTETERDALAVALVHIQQTLTAVDRHLDAKPAEPQSDLAEANAKITHGTQVRVFPGRGKPHGLGVVTWISKNVDPTKSEYGVQLAGYANTSVKHGEFEVVSSDGD